MRAIALIGLPALLLATPAGADGNVQPWPTIVVNAPIGGGWSAGGEIVGRASSEATQSSQLETRFQLGRAIDRNVTLWAGYVHVVTYNDGRRDGIEDQAVEQLNWNAGAIGPLRFSSRTRLEQRFIVGNDRTAWRVREQLRAALPIAHTRLSAIAWAEPFLALNHTRATTMTFEQLRSFAGISTRLSPRADVEIGYLNQYLRRPSGNVSNNVVPVVLNFRF